MLQVVVDSHSCCLHFDPHSEIPSLATFLGISPLDTRIVVGHAVGIGYPVTDGLEGALKVVVVE
jgi:hypothetical protein